MKPCQTGTKITNWKTLMNMLKTAVMILTNGKTSQSLMRKSISNSLKIDITLVNRAPPVKLTISSVLSLVDLPPASGSTESTYACWTMISSREIPIRSSLEMERLSSPSTHGNVWALRRQTDKLISSSKMRNTWIFLSSSSYSQLTPRTARKTLLNYILMPPLCIKPEWSRRDWGRREWLMKL